MQKAEWGRPMAMQNSCGHIQQIAEGKILPCAECYPRNRLPVVKNVPFNLAKNGGKEQDVDVVWFHKFSGFGGQCFWRKIQ